MLCMWSYPLRKKEFFLKLAVPKNLAKSLKTNCEKLHFYCICKLWVSNFIKKNPFTSISEELCKTCVTLTLDRNLHCTKMKFFIKDSSVKETADLVIFAEEILNEKPNFLCSVMSVYDAMSTRYINQRFHRCQLAITLHHSCLKISMQSSTRLLFLVSFWARNNEKYLKIDINLKHTSSFPFHASVTSTSKLSVDLLCKWFLYNDNTATLRCHLLHILFSIYSRDSSPLSSSVQPRPDFLSKT